MSSRLLRPRADDIAGRRRRRMFAPVSIVAIIAVVVAAASFVSPADAAPDLAPITPEELIEKASAADIVGFSGYVTLATDLGIPDLTAPGVPESPVVSLLSGSNTARVWSAAPDKGRVAILGDIGESGIVRNGADVWTWNSRGSLVGHVRLSDAEHGADAPPGEPADQVLDPSEVARRFLDAVEPSTDVSVRTPTYVADRPAYELVLAPKSDDSLVGEVGISVDAETGMALRVAIVADGSATPAVELGFTSLDMAVPDASVFEFTPPPGAQVDEQTPEHKDGAEQRPADSDEPAVVGQAWDGVVIFDDLELPTEGPVAEVLAQASAVDTAAGTGRVIETTLVSVLVLDDGRVAVGAVVPSALVAAVETVD